MRNVTVCGAAGYTGREMVQSAEVALITAIAVAAAMELEAYAAMRKAFHHHERTNTATSAAAHDQATMAYHDAVAARDAAEQRRRAK